MNAARRLSIIAAAVLPITASALEQSFEFSLEARTHEEQYVTTRTTRIDTSWAPRIYCETWGVEHPCLTAQWKCATYYLGPGETFPEPIELLNANAPGPIFTKENDGGDVTWSLTERTKEHGCEIGVYDGSDGKGKRFGVLLHMGGDDALSNSTYKVRFHLRVDKVVHDPLSAAVTATDGGAASITSDELMPLPAPHAKPIHRFAPAEDQIRSPERDCNVANLDDPANDGVCVYQRQSSRVFYRVTSNSKPDDVTLGMFAVADGVAACELGPGSENGARLCASLPDIGLAIPPIVSFRVEGEGRDEDQLPVGRLNEDVCLAPTVMSFARGGLESLDWTAIAQDGTQRELQAGVDPSTGLRCDARLKLGDNLIVAAAMDANGTSAASERVRVSRGPVGLLHGYLASPDDWDDAANRLTAEGFQVERLDLRNPQTLKGEIRIPFSFHSTPNKNGDRFVTEAAKIEPPVSIRFGTRSSSS